MATAVNIPRPRVACQSSRRSRNRRRGYRLSPTESASAVHSDNPRRCGCLDGRGARNTDLRARMSTSPPSIGRRSGSVLARWPEAAIVNWISTCYRSPNKA